MQAIPPKRLRIGRRKAGHDARFGVAQARTARDDRHLHEEIRLLNSSVMAFWRTVLRRIVEMTSVAPRQPDRAIRTKGCARCLEGSSRHPTDYNECDEPTLTVDAIDPTVRTAITSAPRGSGGQESEGPWTTVIHREGMAERVRGQTKDHGV